MAKFLKRLGTVGKRAGRYIARKIGKVFDKPDASFSEKLDLLEAMAPLMEITASVAIIHNNDPRILPFLAQTLTSVKTLDNMVDWTYRYIARLESELLGAQLNRYPVWLQTIIPVAHAVGISEAAMARFVRELSEVLDGMKHVDIDFSAPNANELAAKHFDDALEIFLKHVDDADYAFKQVTNDMSVLRALINVGEMGSADTVKVFVKHQGYTIGLNAIFKEVDFIQAFADMPVNKLSDDAQKAVAGLINSFGNSLGFKVTKGNIAHVLLIADMLRKTDTKVLQVEFYDEALITLSESIFKGRRIDLQIEINGRIIDVEVKNVFSHRWKELLTGGMKKITKGTNEASKAAEETGQLYMDIVKYIQNGNSGKQYMFTPDVIKVPDGVDSAAFRRDPANIAKAEDEIIDFIKELVDKNANELADEFKLDLTDADDLTSWRDLRKELLSSFKGNGDDGQKFVKIYGFENIATIEN